MSRKYFRNAKHTRITTLAFIAALNRNDHAVQVQHVYIDDNRNVQQPAPADTVDEIVVWFN